VLNSVVSAFPLKALADGLRSSYDPAAHGLPAASIAVLMVWALAGVGLAWRFFRWEP
jgi:ABC-2 type transport system permease protein